MNKIMSTIQGLFATPTDRDGDSGQSRGNGSLLDIWAPRSLAGLVLLCILLAGYLGLFLAPSFETTSRSSLDALSNLSQVQQLVTAQSNDQRGYLLTGDQEFLNQFDQKSTRIDQLKKSLVLESPQQQQQFNQAMVDYGSFRSLQPQLVTAVLGGNKAVANDLALVKGRDASNKAQDELGKLKEDVTSSSKDQASVIASVIRGVAAGFLLMALVMGVAAYQVIGSAARLRAADNRVALASEVERKASRLREVGAQVAQAAQKLVQASDELVGTTTDQRAAAMETSASMEELSRTTATIADTVEHVSSLAGDTRQNLELAQSDLRHSSERMLRLAEVVKEAYGGLTLIKSVADQTNLLALNAAIEAARAGDAGRGFAVVADEVRKLADSTKSSAGRIDQLLTTARSDTDSTVTAMEKGLGQLQQSVALMEQVVTANSQVGQATLEQRAGAQQVAQAMDQLTVSSNQIFATAEQLAASAGEQAKLAVDLEDDQEDPPSATSPQAPAGPDPTRPRRRAPGALMPKAGGTH